MSEEEFEEASKYIVGIETISGSKTLDIEADNILDLYNKVSDYADFVRVLTINE